MRNLKRVLSTIMAVAMLMSLVVFSASADTVIFTDKEKITHTEAVDMAVALKIILGYEDGTFRPEGDITRAEMTKMIAVLMHGGMDPVLGTNPSGATFTDIRGHWAEKYIEYCVAEGIVAGLGDGTFDPDGKVTGTQAAKMLLVSLGYSAEFEDFNTSNWATRIGVCAADRKLFHDVNVDPNAPLSRDNAAQMIWNALQAFEVEYTTEWYMDANGNPAARQVAKNKSNGTTGASAYITLLEDKYECNTFEGTLANTYWDKSAKVFKYSFADGLEWMSGIGYTGTGANNKTLFSAVESATDYSDLFAMNTKVVLKKDNKTVLGIVVNGSVIMAEGIFDDFEKVAGETSVRLNGTKYRADSSSNANLNTMTAGNLDVIACAENDFGFWVDVNDNGSIDAGERINLADDVDVAWNVRLIDWDGNGRFDYAVYTPFNVGKITYVGNDSVTVSNAGVVVNTAVTNPLAGNSGTIGIGIAGTYDYDVAKIYEGATKDDYVVIYPANNTPYDTEVIEKMETVTGELTRLVKGAVGTDVNPNIDPASGEGWYIDGEAYFVHPDAAKANNGSVLLGNEYEVYQINGFAFGQDLGKSNYSMDDVLMVFAYEKGGVVSSDQAKVYFAKDGSSSVINVDELYIKDPVTNKLKNDDADDQAGVKAMETYTEYKLFTFTEKNGMYVLEEICADNKLGFNEYTEKGTGIKESSKVAGTLDNTAIAEEAVIFIVHRDGSVKAKVIAGKAAADLDGNFGYPAANTSTYLTNKTGNLTQVQLAVVVDTTKKLPTVSGIVGNFGYVVSNNGTVKLSDGGTYHNFTIYTGKGLVVVNCDESAAANIKKNQVITYSDMGDNIIEDVKTVDSSTGVYGRPESGDFSAVGAIIGYNGSTAQFQVGDNQLSRLSKVAPAGASKLAGDALLYTYDSDTVFLQVKTLDKTGVSIADSGILSQTAMEIDASGVYRDNCVFVVGENKVLKLVIVDTDNKWLDGYSAAYAASPDTTLKAGTAITRNDGTDVTTVATTTSWTADLKGDTTSGGAVTNKATVTIAPNYPKATLTCTTSDTAIIVNNNNGTFSISNIADNETVTFTVTPEKDGETPVNYTITFDTTV